MLRDCWVWHNQTWIYFHNYWAYKRLLYSNVIALPCFSLPLQLSRHTMLIENLGRVLFWEPQKRTLNRPRRSFFVVALDSGLVERAIGRKQVLRKQPEMWRKYNTRHPKKLYQQHFHFICLDEFHWELEQKDILQKPLRKCLQIW